MGALRADFPCRHGQAPFRDGWAPLKGFRKSPQRLQRVQIENAPALEVVQRYDTPETVFYLDPPYVHDARGDAAAYGFEMTDQDHIELAAVLNRIRGRAVLSGYRTELYDDLFSDWERIDAKKRNCHSVRKPRQESAWVNF